VKRRVAHFDSEAQMCALYIAVATGEVSNSSYRARPTGWKPYAETGGFDILMVRDDGFQVGIEAKLRLNDDVILQILESPGSVTLPGPDCRAVLVPDGTGSRLHHEVCARLGIEVITITAETSQGRYQLVSPDLPKPGHWANGQWPEMLPTSRVKLPAFIPDVVAGSKSPVQLTDWKIKAIKIACILERRGWLCRSDFKAIGIDHRRFLDNQWVVPVDGSLRRGSHWPDLRKQHPRNFVEIDAIYSDWAPPEPAGVFGRLL
jgi:hypothetical protein